MLLDLHHVRTFVAVAVTCNFTKAAKQLGCSQPTVTLHIRTLERQLGALLFERKRFSKVHSLTAAGSQVYEYAVKLLNLAEEIPAVVRKMADAGGTVAPPSKSPQSAGSSAELGIAQDLREEKNVSERHNETSHTFVRHSLRHKSLKV